MVDDKLSDFVSHFFKDSRDSTAEIAAKIDAVSDAVLGSCDDSGIRSADGHAPPSKPATMPASRAGALDKLRAGRPAVYAALREGASNVAFAPPLAQRAALAAAAAAADVSAKGHKF